MLADAYVVRETVSESGSAARELEYMLVQRGVAVGSVQALG